MIAFLIGVDGGGSGTRACLAHLPHQASGVPVHLGAGMAGPSGLSLGITNAWTAVEQAIAAAFASAGLPLAPRAAIALGLGLAGVHNRQWAAQFTAANPGYASLALASDGHTTVLAAPSCAPSTVVWPSDASARLA